MKIGNPLNEVQSRFNELCDLGGGVGGGPARSRVQELLHDGSKKLNQLAFDQITSQLAEYSTADPWHVCFVVGLTWGHLAKDGSDFTAAALPVLSALDEDALNDARKYHLERGPEPIEQSLRGGYSMFQRVRLPDDLPDTLAGFTKAQERWFSPLLSPSQPRPKYIGSWNATAMFMIGLFSKPNVAAECISASDVALPPNGPINAALKTLHSAKLLSEAPAGGTLDDGSWEPGVVYENNGLMAEFLKGHPGWSKVDLHSGLYMLGTRYPLSSAWA